MPDPAEHLRDALRRQRLAQRRYELAKRDEPSPDESSEDRARRLEDLRAAAEAADADMERLRPDTTGRPGPGPSGPPAPAPPMPPGVSN